MPLWPHCQMEIISFRNWRDYLRLIHCCISYSEKCHGYGFDGSGGTKLKMAALVFLNLLAAIKPVVFFDGCCDHKAFHLVLNGIDDGGIE